MEIETTVCASPSVQTIDLCKNCKRNKPPQEDQEPEWYTPRRKIFNGYECAGYEKGDSNEDS